jgi:hypothetical protein
LSDKFRRFLDLLCLLIALAGVTAALAFVTLWAAEWVTRRRARRVAS